LKVNSYYLNVEKLLISKKRVEEIVRVVIGNEFKKIGTINIIFTNNKKILEINKKFLNHHYYTDVITFNNSKKDTIAGDIFISTEQVDRNAKEYLTTNKNETIRVIIHGLLHLIGYDDKELRDLHIMRSKEDMYLSTINKMQISKNEKKV
jgi:probable rRNA maturation factor